MCVFLFTHTIFVLIKFRSRELTQYFRQCKENNELPRQDRLSYIPYPTFIWWSVQERKITPRFIGEFTSPVHYFEALWTDEIMRHICHETGLITHDSKVEKLTPHMVKMFLGQELIRGYIGVTNMRLLWSTKSIIIDYPGKANALWKNHWFAISNELNFDPAFIHRLLIDRFKLHLVPGYNVTVDEIRIPCTHESCSFKNHNRQKPDVWAVESKSLHADNGYLLDFIYPCQEKVPTPSESLFQFATWLLTTERRHHIVADSNFLSALDLPRLETMGIQATISCKNTRPSFIWKRGLEEKLPEGYTRIASSQIGCCIVTRNKGKPKIATTLCYAVNDKARADVKERRDVLNIYDNLKGKADYFGHLYKEQYPHGNHQNWLVTLLLGWFYFALTNSYILYTMRNNELTHKEFIYEIAKFLLSV